MDGKKLFREQMITKLKGLSLADYEERSSRIANDLCQNCMWQEAGTIAITVSRFPEVDTYQIIRKAWEQGKKITVPKCFPADRTMIFRSLDKFEQLEQVYYGLYEPIIEETEEVTSEKIGLMVVPGLAFTPQGFRLGFGGGYYDRYLEGYRGRTVSLAFSEQVVSGLPVEPHDMPVECVITEMGIVGRGN
ncbi:5-formyltetrahydrofolate cyclo-ligase [Mesobacillus zeae]|nr:5-formyltetrahydrofolate cyclo-ligase [Mesobacillus zeae]